jgi:hypothetical protein
MRKDKSNVERCWFRQRRIIQNVEGNACEQFPSRIKATFNVAGSAEGGLSKMSKEIACEQFPSKEE